MNNSRNKNKETKKVAKEIVSFIKDHSKRESILRHMIEFKETEEKHEEIDFNMRSGRYCHSLSLARD